MQLTPVACCTPGFSAMLRLSFACLLVCVFAPIHVWGETPHTAAQGEASSNTDAPSDVSGEEHVVVITTDNYDSYITDTSIVLVEFYAPWCGHCKKLEPEFQKAAEDLKKAGSKVVLAKVDATVEKELAEKHSVMGFPTIKFFRHGVAEEYTGQRSAESIVQWVDKMTAPAVVQSTEAEIKAAIDKGVKVAYVCTVIENSELYKLCKAAAESSRHLGKFYVVTATDGEQIRVIRAEEEPDIYDGKKDLEAVKTWIAEVAIPLFGPINGDNYQHYMGLSRELVWSCGQQEDYDAHKAAIREVAMILRSKYTFVWLNTKDFPNYAQSSFGVQEFPALVLQSKNGRFLMPEASKFLTSVEKVKKFLSDVAAGNIERSLKSEDIPKENNLPVKVVVGKNFEEMVLRPDKDVMLEVYASWCGHCKKFEPHYIEFAEKAEAERLNLVVAKMDGTVNESPVDGFECSGFPTIFYVKAGSKTGVVFDGDRTVDGLMKYAKQQASTPAEKEPVKEEL